MAHDARRKQVVSISITVLLSSSTAVRYQLLPSAYSKTNESHQLRVGIQVRLAKIHRATFSSKLREINA